MVNYFSRVERIYFHSLMRKKERFPRGQHNEGMVFLELYFGYFDHKPAGTPLPIMHVQKEYFKPV